MGFYQSSQTKIHSRDNFVVALPKFILVNIHVFKKKIQVINTI